MIKLFAVDMDGTLLNNDKIINESSKKAIDELHKAGVKTVLVSGRIAPSILDHTKKLGTNNPIIGNNGAIIKLNEDITLNTHPIDDEDLKELLDFSNENKIFFHFYDEDTYYSNNLNVDRISHMLNDNEYGLNYVANINISSDPFEEIIIKGRHALKFQLNFVDTNPLGKDKIYDLFKERFNDRLYITSSGPTVFEIMNKDVNKGNALKELSEFLGIKSDEIAAIGDSYNDIPMIDFAKLKFAMGNGNDKIKEMADYVVSSNEEDGIKVAASIILDTNREILDV